MNALLSLSSAVSQFNQNPETSGDMLASAASTAGIAVQQTAQPFNVDPQMSYREDGSRPAGGAHPLRRCAAAAPASWTARRRCAHCWANSPFNPCPRPRPAEISPCRAGCLGEVNTVFAPGTGSLWTYYNASLKPWLVQQGTQYVLAPNAAGHVGPVFAQFFNRAATVSSALYSSGGNNPAFNVTLRSVPSKGIDNATLVVDGQRIPAGATSQQFTWNGATAHQASLAYNSAEALQFQGPWALFQLVATAQVTRVGPTLQLEFPLEVSGRQLRLPDGTPEVVRFEISGPGAAVLAPLGLYGGSCGVPVTK